VGRRGEAAASRQLSYEAALQADKGDQGQSAGERQPVSGPRRVPGTSSAGEKRLERAM
jgi:hypothetical protein